MDMDMGIGKDGTLPWPYDEADMTHFRELTMGHYVVMGSKTWDDPAFPGPLKGRKNIVISSRTNGFDGATVFQTNFKQTLKMLDKTSPEDIWIIGGANLINQCHDIIDEYHITCMQEVYNCDTFLEMPPGLHMTEYGDLGDNKYCIFKKEEI